jgi:hypothetical protein
LHILTNHFTCLYIIHTRTPQKDHPVNRLTDTWTSAIVVVVGDFIGRLFFLFFFILIVTVKGSIGSAVRIGHLHVHAVVQHRITGG